MAYVLTSISGNPISAASAGYAPTNSADVSAIASGYQVVSSTSTQLYAGTAFLTSVNDAPVSASRAGNAANAGMANSAYYDGTGRLISSLPDSAAVSSIASSYAESAASGKLDSSSIETSVDGITGIAGTAIAGGGASYTSPSGTIIVGADTLEGTDSGVGITNLTSYQKSGYLSTTYGVSASGSSNYPTIFKLSGSTGTLSCRISSNGVYYTSVSVEELNGPVVIPSGSWRIQKNNYAPMNWTAENYYSGTANVQLAHKSDVAVSSITRIRFYDYSTNPATPSTAVSAINGEPILAMSALSARHSEFASYTDDGRPLSAMVTTTPYSKNGTIHVTGLEVEGSDSAFMPSPYVESGTVTAVPSEWQSSVSATRWNYQWNTDTSANISRIDISGLNSAGSVSIRMGNYRGDGDLSTSLLLAPYVTNVYELKAPIYVDYVYLDVSSQNSASSISSITFTAYSQESGTVVPLAHASSLPTYGYDGTAITSIDGSAIGGVGGGIDSATVSAIASSYAESAVSGKQDTLTFAYDADSAISSINGSALAGGGGGATGDYVEKSANNVAIGNPSPSASGTGFAHGFLVKAENYSVALASFAVTATNTSFGQGYYVTATQSSFGQGVSSEAVDNSFAQGTQSTASARSFAQGYGDVARTCSFAQGYDNKASDYSFAQGRGNIARHSSTAFGQYNLHYDGDTATGNSAAFTIGDGAFGARHDLMLVTKDGEITMYSSTADTVGTGIMSSIRAISAAATGGGVDSATVSAIASSYAESAVSGKMDSSAMTSYALSADVSGTVDLVSTQSANWGGSALALSAGPGISLTLSGNTLVASTDETVLFENAAAGTAGAHSVTLSETLRNFEKALIMVSDDSTPTNRGVIMLDMSESPVNGSCNIAWPAGFRLITVSSTDWITWSIDGYQWYGSGGSTIGSNYLAINKVVGINRTAGV